MKKDNNLLAIIPARSGSKGIQDKNIRYLGQKPLMAYSIDAAKESGLFSKIHVSTDSPLYAQIAEKYGADIPFLRDQSLATDQSNTWDVVQYVLNEYGKRGERIDYVCLLQPTSPLRTERHIREAFERMRMLDADAVVSVCEADHSPMLCNTLDATGSMYDFIPDEILKKGRQKLTVYYRLNGAIYFFKADLLERFSSIYKSRCFAYIMDRESSVDIDEELDFLLAEVILKRRATEI